MTWFTDAEKIPARYPTAKPEEKPISKRALKNAGHRTRGEGSKTKNEILKSRRCAETGLALSLAGSSGTPANRFLGPPHNCQPPAVLLALSVGCLPLAVEAESLAHRSKLFWQLTAQDWTILFFGIGVKLPAKLVAIEENRSIAATLSWRYASAARCRRHHRRIANSLIVQVRDGSLSQLN